MILRDFHDGFTVRGEQPAVVGLKNDQDRQELDQNVWTSNVFGDIISCRKPAKPIWHTWFHDTDTHLVFSSRFIDS
jgi:hypothetical protein